MGSAFREDIKYCPKCEEDRPVGEFCRNGARSDGPSGYCRPCQQAAERRRREKLRAELLALLGDVCIGCGFSDARALQVDHVNGGGRRQREAGLWAAGRAFVEHVRTHPAEYQLLCANCNQIKKIEQNESVGRRVYVRDVPVARLRGVGRGNAPGSSRGLDVSSERQRARARKYWEGVTQEQREEHGRKMRAIATGRRLVDGHWVRPSE